MKFMGSKRTMVMNGLGNLLDQSLDGADRFVDLFSGSGQVSWHVAEKFFIPVLASDLQDFSRILAASVIERCVPLLPDEFLTEWFLSSYRYIEEHDHKGYFREFEEAYRSSPPAEYVERARLLCRKCDDLSIVSAYGGHYFSPIQALSIEALRANLPIDPSNQVAALASLIGAASGCAAAPGHTAQPFKPTESGAPHLLNRWRLNIFEKTLGAVEKLSLRSAKCEGQALTQEATSVVDLLGPGDVAFVDPPYSNVQYSRFYHVLETVARGSCSPVSGIGRYPPPHERPQSLFSNKGTSLAALDGLLKKLAGNRVQTILTFPSGDASNGLSGSSVGSIASKYFSVESHVTTSKFSTLGGNGKNRLARHSTPELMLRLLPL